MNVEKTTPATQPTDPGWAWAPYAPGADRPWDLRLASHLFRRAIFGASWSRLQQAVDDGPERTISELLNPAGDVAAFDRQYDAYEASAASSTTSLRAWWLRRMLDTPHPLLEKMALFWHDHFAVSGARVSSGTAMHAHIRLLRSHALGDFRALLGGTWRDPAVLVSLDATANRRARPNEGYARALMELFALGPGQFSERDVSEAARAFTGWFVLRNELRHIDREHDTGTKQVLGKRGEFDGEDVVRIVLEQPATARLIVRKLYRWLISETSEPPGALVEPLAKSFAEKYDVTRLVGTMLRSNLFFSPAAYRQKIKSPVEYALGLVNALEGKVGTAPLGGDLEQLGQNLYHPPTIKGWPGGRHWIQPVTLIRRANLARALVATSGRYEKKLDPEAVAKKHGFETPEATTGFLIDLLLGGDLDESVRRALLETSDSDNEKIADASARLRELVHSLASLPEFQLA